MKRKGLSENGLQAILITLLAIVAIAGCAWVGHCRWYWMCKFAEENNGRLERYGIGYNYSQDSDGTASGSTEYALRVVLPDGSTVTEEELLRRGKLNYFTTR